MKTLKHPYLSVKNKTGTAYGGSQSWFSYGFLKKNGCGVISAADVLLHLQGKEAVSETEYMEFAKKLWMQYLPVIPGFGMNGLTLVLGLNRYFWKHGMSYRAGWNIGSKNLLPKIDGMLAKDLPVILPVGPNFPKFWGKEKLNFYRKTETATFVPAVKTSAHFVTVTGREGHYLKISSWGKEYYIDVREYRRYVRNYSSFLISNIVYIR